MPLPLPPRVCEHLWVQILLSGCFLPHPCLLVTRAKATHVAEKGPSETHTLMGGPHILLLSLLTWRGTRPQKPNSADVCIHFLHPFHIVRVLLEAEKPPAPQSCALLLRVHFRWAPPG